MTATELNLQQNMPPEKRSVFQYQMSAVRKNSTTFMLLAGFLGYLGLHRFYLGQPGLGILLLLLSLTGIGLIVVLPWCLVDVVQASRLVDEYNELQARKIASTLSAW